jgi:subtilisin family serine protease
MPNQTPPEPQTTGRYLVTFRQGAEKEAIRLMDRAAGIRGVANASDFDAGAVRPEAVGDADGVYFDQLGVAVVTTPPDAVTSLQAAAAEEDNASILAVEPELIMEALADGPSLDYLRGYRDAVDHLYEQLAGGATAEAVGSGGSSPAGSSPADTGAATWGLAATRVTSSRFSGQGVRVAVLDTGIDFQHPDFAGRAVTAQSFIPGDDAQDRHGHGTHCIGTACGPQQPGEGRRYGIAWQAEVFAGKVLADNGKGPDGGILAGINWAIANGCRVISMSLGVQGPPSVIYEQVAQRALAAGSLIVAAAGNDSWRNFGLIFPVSRAANCPSIVAVAAVDPRFQVANFSNRGMDLAGGQVDIAGPGVDIWSAAPMPVRHRTLSGTSMATPYVAGIAALWAEARQAAGAALFQVLASSARRLPAFSVDVGAGLVQAP